MLLWVDLHLACRRIVVNICTLNTVKCERTLKVFVPPLPALHFKQINYDLNDCELPMFHTMSLIYKYRWIQNGYQYWTIKQYFNILFIRVVQAQGVFKMARWTWENCAINSSTGRGYDKTWNEQGKLILILYIQNRHVKLSQMKEILL